MTRRPAPGTRASRWGVADVVILVAIVLAALVVVAGIVLFSPAILLAIPILLGLDWIRRRRFLRRFAGQTFVIVSRRHGWRDFVVNNVEPVLPAGTSCIWHRSRDELKRVQGPGWFLRWRTKRPAGICRPYAVVISPRPLKMRFVPLHDALLPLKPGAKRSSATQSAVKEALEARLRQSDS